MPKICVAENETRMSATSMTRNTSGRKYVSSAMPVTSTWRSMYVYASALRTVSIHMPNNSHEKKKCIGPIHPAIPTARVSTKKAFVRDAHVDDILEGIPHE